MARKDDSFGSMLIHTALLVAEVAIPVAAVALLTWVVVKRESNPYNSIFEANARPLRLGD